MLIAVPVAKPMRLAARQRLVAIASGNMETENMDEAAPSTREKRSP
jgi:hypothetical protein